MEIDFGLTTFLCRSRKETINCILKRLYSDFIVLEIDGSKNVTRLLTVSEANTQELQTTNDTVKLNDIPRPSVFSEEFQRLCDAVFAHESDETKLETSSLDKSERGQVHGYIRARYGEVLDSETASDACIIVKKSKNNTKRRRWGQDTPPYVHFTMEKENKETSFALGIVAKMSGCNISLFKSCGLKDRRGVTAQRVSAFQVHPDKLRGLNARLRDIVLYDFEYKKEPVRTGSHWGNRFCILLRDIDPCHEDVLRCRLEEWDTLGFINYYGTQRFGSCETRTADVGRLILQRKWKEAVMEILGGGARNGNDTVQKAVEVYKESEDAGAALKELKGCQQYASIEGQILRTLSKGKSWQESVIQLPNGTKSLYVHAYQSLLWNRLASSRVSLHGTSTVNEDLDEKGESLNEERSHFDVHIPLASSSCTDRKGYAFTFYEKVLESDGLNWDSFRTLERNFSLGDSSTLQLRPLFVKPGDVKWQFVRYSDRNEQIQQSLTSIVEERKNEGDLFGLKVEFDLPSGTYATVALREITACDMGKHHQKSLNMAAGDQNIGEEIQNEPEKNEA